MPFSENNSLNEFVKDEKEKELIYNFFVHVRDTYNNTLRFSSLRFAPVTVGMSRVNKLFMYSDTIYPYFLKVGKNKNISREDSKYGHAARKIPALSIPPKETIIRNKSGELALIAFRYVTGNSKIEAPETLFSMYKKMPVYRMITVVDELFQIVLSDYHSFSTSEIEQKNIPDIDISIINGINNISVLDRMIKNYNDLVNKTSFLFMPCGLIHGDLHCENILVGRYFNPIVLDFEMALDKECLFRDFAEFEIAMLFAAACTDFDNTESAAEAFYSQTNILQICDVDKFTTLLQRIRANLIASVKKKENISRRSMVLEDLNIAYSIYLMRYICLYCRVAALNTTGSTRRTLISFFEQIFEELRRNTIKSFPRI